MNSRKKEALEKDTLRGQDYFKSCSLDHKSKENLLQHESQKNSQMRPTFSSSCDSFNIGIASSIGIYAAVIYNHILNLLTRRLSTYFLFWNRLDSFGIFIFNS